MAEIACLDITNGERFSVAVPIFAPTQISKKVAKVKSDNLCEEERTESSAFRLLCCLGAFCLVCAFQHVLCRGKGLPLEDEDKVYWPHVAASRSIQYSVRHTSFRIEQRSKLACDEGIPSSAPA